MTSPGVDLAVLLAGLGRWPDVDDPTLVAVDASDRLLLDLAADDWPAPAPATWSPCSTGTAP